MDGLDAIKDAAEDAKDQFVELANTELPSDKLQRHVDGWQRVSREAAEAAVSVKRYNDAVTDQPSILPQIAEENEQRLDSLQRTLGYQEQVINRAYENRKKQIDALVLSEVQIQEAGFESMEALQKAYHAQSEKQWLDELEKLEGSRGSFWERFAEDIEKSTGNFSDLWSSTFNKFTADFGDAVADAIVDGEDFRTLCRRLLRVL